MVDKPETMRTGGTLSAHVPVARLGILAIAACMLPGVLLVLGNASPAFAKLLWPAGAHHSIFLCHGNLGLEAQGLADVTALAYWIGVALLVGRALGRAAGWPTLMAAWFASASAATLLFVMPTVAGAWTLAAARGSLPPWPWEEFGGNHGPWYFTCDVRWLAEVALLIPIPALALSGVSMMIRPSWTALALAAACGVTFFVVGFSHAWLID